MRASSVSSLALAALVAFAEAGAPGSKGDRNRRHAILGLSERDGAFVLGRKPPARYARTPVARMHDSSGASGGGGPPPSGGGMPPDGEMGGTDNAGGATPSSSSPHAGAMLGRVGGTTVATIAGKEDMTTSDGAADQDIYGPFEAGFTSAQDFILEALGCATPSDGYVPGGIDTVTAESMVGYACGVELPRYDASGNYISLIDECGGHTRE